VLLGPSAAGGAYIPAFCDVVIMVKSNASMYLGSPRMAQMVIGENTTLEEMGGAQMHCSVSGCGDFSGRHRTGGPCARHAIFELPSRQLL
jgi:acetyl-CoA carboxylase carboxyltransferase component